MDRQTIERLTALITPILTDQGLELVELQLRNEQAGLVLRVIIYKDSGITIDDCSQVSREISRLLEIEDPINQAYSLEVSSPGLTRPLTSERDFARNRGQKVKIKFAADDAAPQTIIGIIVNTDSKAVELEVDGKHEKILLAKIHKAKLVIEF